jgi:hypothetical protein
MKRGLIAIMLAAAGLALAGCASSRPPFYGTVVVTPNHYIEADPDINIRYELLRDWARGKGN